jgi:hypothetical protein
MHGSLPAGAVIVLLNVVTVVAESVLVAALDFLLSRRKMVIQLECENVLLACPRDRNEKGHNPAAGRTRSRRTIGNHFARLFSKGRPRMEKFHFLFILRLIALLLIAPSQRLQIRNDWTATGERH